MTDDMLTLLYKELDRTETLEQVIDGDDYIARFLSHNIDDVVNSIKLYRVDKRDDGPKEAERTLDSATRKILDELMWRGMIEEASYISNMDIQPRIKASDFNNTIKEFYSEKLIAKGYDQFRTEEIVIILFSLAELSIVIGNVND